MRRRGKPDGAGRGGAAERVTRVEGSTSYGEGEHQPAKTDRKARGRPEQQIAGQSRGGRIRRDRTNTVNAEGSTERGREGTTVDERREVARERVDEQLEEAEHERQGTDSTWESAGLPKLGKPDGAGRGGAAERVTRVEGSTSYGEGEHQPAKTERKARGRTEQRRAG